MTETKAPHPEDYRPYNVMPEFMKGYAAYSKGLNGFLSPYSLDSDQSKAWDRGRDYAYRLARWNRLGV